MTLLRHLLRVVLFVYRFGVPFFAAIWPRIDGPWYGKAFKLPVTAVAEQIVAKEDL